MGKNYQWFGKKWFDEFTSVHYDPVRQGDICKKEMREVQYPTLVVHGDEDAMVPPYQTEFLQNNLRKCQLDIITGGRHAPHWKHNSLFNKIVHDFLRDINNPSYVVSLPRVIR